jgi:quinoprotein glucose dehydrogenase
MKKRAALLVTAITATAFFGPSLAADLSAEWPTNGHDKGNMRFSPLNQITPANVGGLQQAWVFHMRPAYLDNPAAYAQYMASSPFGRGGRGGRAGAATPPQPGGRGYYLSSEMTPLVVHGLMILATPYRRVTAIDATTGKQVWAYDTPGGDGVATRGVEYWEQGNRIIVATQGGKIIALDAKTGEPAKGFGKDGVLETRTEDVLNGQANTAYGYSSPPLVVNNVIVTGSRVQETPTLGAAGDVRGWDARTGKLLWTFHSVPRPGELGHDTWGGDSWKNRSGVNVWTLLAADPKRDIVYAPFGAPAFDRWGGDRPGNNLFSDSIVAIQASTGKYLWHFQVVHHDIWDVDLPVATLVDVKKGGKVIPAIAVMSKMAILFVLDRVTGKPLHEVREVPVPTDTDIPDEKPSPTQPMSVTPPLGKLSWETGDVANVTPEHRAYCEKFIADNKGVAAKMFQPLRVDSAPVSFPGSLGGADWGGGSFDPKNGLFVINTNNLAHFSQQVKRPDGSYGMLKSYQYFWEAQSRMPCQNPPWGQLSAVDVSTGQIKWQVNLGVSDNLPAGKQDTGRVNLGNPMLTAGGLTFIGATDDLRFRAFDTKTGKEVWTTKVPGSASTGPVTYRGRDGRQYVAVVATGGNNAGAPVLSDQVIAYALPKK